MSDYPEEKHCCTICDAKKLCSICKTPTLYACSDCQIDFGVTIYVCSQSTCRQKHEQKCSARLRQRYEATDRRYRALAANGWRVVKWYSRYQVLALTKEPPDLVIGLGATPEAAIDAAIQRLEGKT